MSCYAVLFHHNLGHVLALAANIYTGSHAVGLNLNAIQIEVLNRRILVSLNTCDTGSGLLLSDQLVFCSMCSQFQALMIQVELRWITNPQYYICVFVSVAGKIQLNCIGYRCHFICQSINLACNSEIFANRE